MELSLIIEMIIAALFGAVLYTIIGVAPGTDETATIAPVTLIVVLSGVEPIVILSFFMAAIVSNKVTDSIPVAVAGIPGGVMSAPMVEHAVTLKNHGLPDVSIRKMASGSVIGTVIAVPLSIILAYFIAPVGEHIVDYSDQIFFGGAIFLALLTKHRWIALLSIIPFGLLIQGLREFYWATNIVPADKSIFISLFLGITIGPVILRLAELLSRKKRDTMPRMGKKDIELVKEEEVKTYNPLKILDRKEIGTTVLTSVSGVVTFFLSPVGMTVFLGEVLSSRIKDPVKRAARAVSGMEGVTSATYIAGTLIPLIALGIPLSPTALGPGNPLFNAPPVFTLDHNLHHLLSMSDFIIASVIGATIALGLTYWLMMKYAQKICAFVFKYVPHEAMLGLFFGLVVMLAYMEAGWLNIIGVLLVALVAGFLNRKGVGYGVQFMSLYAAPWIFSWFF